MVAGRGSPPEVTPIDLPRLAELPEFDDAYRERMLWGTYRCGQYLGTCPTLIRTAAQHVSCIIRLLIKRTALFGIVRPSETVCCASTITYGLQWGSSG